MARVEHSVVIGRPVDEVFAFVTCVENNVKWQPSLLAAAADTAGPVGVGSRFRERRRVLGIPVESEYAIEEFDPPCRCAVRSLAGPLSFHVAYRLCPIADGTLMCVVGDVTQDAILGLPTTAATRLADRALAASLHTLKRVLEGGPAPIAGAVA
jgi:hypothetical protein